MRRLTIYTLCAIGLLTAVARAETQPPAFVDADGDGIHDAYQGIHRARGRARGRADLPTALARVNMTDEQRARLRQVSSDHQKAIAPLKTALDAAQTRLREAMQAEQPDRKVVEERIDALNAVRTRIQKAVSSYQLTVQGILTPEQWMELNRAARAAKAEGPGPGQKPAGELHDIFVDEDGDGICDGRGAPKKPGRPMKRGPRGRGNPDQ